MPGKIKPAEGEPTLQGALIDVDPITCRAISIRRISVRSTEEL
jgi:calcineurin-like phosphoesterase